MHERKQFEAQLDVAGNSTASTEPRAHLIAIELMKPIPGGAHAGDDLRLETRLDSLYFRMKDARAQARTIERAAETAGDPPPIPDEWRMVRNLAIEALTSRTKDLEIATWLIEAELRVEGFSGLAAGFDLVRGFIENFWPELHSIDEDDVAGRVSPLSGLNGTGGEGALVKPIRMLSLFPDTPYGIRALWHWARAQRSSDGALVRDFDDARMTAGIAAIRERAVQAAAAREAFAAMTAALDRACGADAPPSSHIRNVLEEVGDAYRALLGGDVEMSHESAGAMTGVTQSVSVATPSAADRHAAEVREIATREEAFAELLRIADFFRRNEPHSPISYTLNTLVARGRMSFVELLEELMPNADSRKQLLQHAGIQATVEGRGG